MLKSISLTNWRSHKDSVISFGSGTNLLVGIMGSGKSSVLEAISFALFGTFPNLERRKVHTEDLIRLNEESARIALIFVWDGFEYRVERILERNKRGVVSGAELFKDGKLLESGQSAITSYLQKLLSLDYDLFLRAIYCEQNNLDYFLTLDPRRRKAEIDALLGLDRFETARANLITVMGRYSLKRKTLTDAFSKAKLDDLLSKRLLAATALSGLDKQFSDLDLAVASNSSAISDLSARFETLEKVRLAIEKLDREVLSLNAKHESYLKDLEGFALSLISDCNSKISMKENERLTLLANIKTHEDVLSPALKEIAQLESKIANGRSVQKSISSLNEELLVLLAPTGGKSPSQLVSDLESIIREKSGSCIYLTQEIKNLSDAIDRLSPSLGKCPTCDSPMGDLALKKIREDKQSLLSSSKVLLSKTNAELLELKKQYDAQVALQKKASILEQKLNILKKDQFDPSPLEAMLVQRSSDVNSLKAEISSLGNSYRTSIAELSSLTSLLSTLNSKAKKATELTEIEKRLAQIQVQKAALSFDGSVFESLRTSLESAKINHERLLGERSLVLSSQKSQRELLSVLDLEIVGLKKIQSDLENLSQVEEELSIYKTALIETQSSLRTTLIDAVNSTLLEIWPLFYPYKNYQSIRVVCSEKDYSFEVNDNGTWKPLEAVASGGERATFALVFRVALAMILTPKLSWLILDEPTHNLDSNAVSLLSNALQFRLPSVIKQTIVITHDEALMGSEFASSYRLDRDKEKNGETKIERV
ncbi:SMC family ATPase [Candidatus Micrarchaeota archaeon]|nr:SMC family ATPase [Candidatus Micrarchaeota archaeon]